MTKPGKKLSLISKVISIVFFLTIYSIRIIFSYIGDEYKLPGIDETLGLIYASLFISMVGLPVDFSIIIQNIRGKRNE